MNRKLGIIINRLVLGFAFAFIYQIVIGIATSLFSLPLTGNIQDLISGIRDGVKLMKKGEIVTFLFPSYKAYGYYGITDKLGTNIPVQCTVTLNNINKNNENY